ncbi:MAG TPA: aldolase/citrate lyase family protein [Alphaproteobacteria bacterium]|nr:aldolase/citrate lyase family protein [Alphaproteobacteria bacterium]
MAPRVNRAIELLESGQPIYYVGGHTGHILTYEQGQHDAKTWADYINVGMEHGAFDMAGLDQYLRGMSDGGPTTSGHRTPTVIVEVPVDGSNEAVVRSNAWQFRQILARGVHGILLCQAESADAVRAFVESCRYPIHKIGVGRGLGIGTRGRGGEPSAAAIWGVSVEDYLQCADVWPLNPRGELLLGVKIESLDGVSRVEQILTVPGIGFAEMGPGDLGLALGYTQVPRDPYPPEMQEARERVLQACQAHGIAFLETCTPENVTRKIDEGIRVIAGHREDTAKIGRAHTKRTMPV